MTVPSYLSKTYFVTDPLAIVRGDDLVAQIWKSGAARPEGQKVGDQKRIPQHTEVRVTAHQSGENRSLYVFAEPVQPDPRIPVGWTRATNLNGLLLNELLGYRPTHWDHPPDGESFTVTDEKALIRDGAPMFRSKGVAIPAGTYVVVVERSTTNPAGKFVKVCAAQLQDPGKVIKGEEIGWTAASNLTEGLSPAFKEAAWKDETGPNAAWRQGTYLGPKVLVDIAGTGAQVEQVALWTLGPYLEMVEAAKQKGLSISLNSGFRTYGHQDKLYKAHLAGKGNLAAKPGRSNHQHGQAFDFNTQGTNTPIYKWLAKNGPKHGFLRTVKSEHWHWEYLPDKAVAAAKAGLHSV